MFFVSSVFMFEEFIIGGLRLVTSVMRYSPPCGGTLAVPYST